MQKELIEYIKEKNLSHNIKILNNITNPFPILLNLTYSFYHQFMRACQM